MTTASDEMAGRGVLGRCLPDEPVFVLRARDLIAPYAAMRWINLARDMGMVPARVADAQAAIDAMHRWRERNKQIVRLPD